MENKKSTGLIVLVVVLSLIAVGLAGFIVYDKVLTKENNVEEKTNENTEKNTSNSETENTTTENSYELFAQNLKEEIKSKFNDDNYIYEYVTNDCRKYSIELNSKGELYITYLDDKSNINNKIASDVLNFYVINTGQDICNSLYFVKEDGTVSMANTEYNNSNEIEVKNNIDNLKNIVSIQNGVFGATESGYHGPIFIDINGNIYGDNLN